MIAVGIQHPELKVEIGAAVAFLIQLQIEVKVRLRVDRDCLALCIHDDRETSAAQPRMIDQLSVDRKLVFSVRHIDGDAIPEGDRKIRRSQRTDRRADKVDELAEIAHGKIFALHFGGSAVGDGDAKHAA